MKSPNEIKQYAEKIYSKFLSATLTDNMFFPIVIKNNREKLSFAQRLNAQKKLTDNSKEKKGFGYTIDFKIINKRKEGKQEIIDKIYFQNQADYLKYINKEKDFNDFNTKTSIILKEFPELLEWILKYPIEITNNKNDWLELIKVCKYFKFNHKKNKYYIRELPIKVHTKFAENNKTILNSLLPYLLPEFLINSNYTGKIKNNSFEKRYFLKYDKTQIRFRILDTNLYVDKVISDISLLPDEFENLNFKCEKIFIAENKMNILTFPQKDNAIIIFGSGKGIKQLKNADWIFDKQIYYWGDLDIQGFEILSQLRSYNIKAKISSLMMNFKTLDNFKDDIDEGKYSKIDKLQNITKTEHEIYNHLKNNNLRLEQEKIKQEYVTEEIRKL